MFPKPKRYEVNEMGGRGWGGGGELITDERAL